MGTLWITSTVTDRYKLGYTDSACHPKCHPFAHCCSGDTYCDCYPRSSNGHPHPYGDPDPDSPKLHAPLG